jgi:hypothetical protein
MAEKIVVTDGNESYIGHLDDYVETHGGASFARVYVPDLNTVEWVKVPDNAKTPTNVLVCEDCGREEVPSDDVEGPLRKENECNHEGSAQALKRVHESLRPSHSPKIEIRA